MLRGFFGNLIFAIIARMLCGNHLNTIFDISSLQYTLELWRHCGNAVKTLACGSYSHRTSGTPKLPLVFLQLGRNTEHVFYFLHRTLLPNSTKHL